MEKLIEALKLIKTACISHNDSCEACPMYAYRYEGCMLYSEHPNNWDILDVPTTVIRVVK